MSQVDYESWIVIRRDPTFYSECFVMVDEKEPGFGFFKYGQATVMTRDQAEIVISQHPGTEMVKVG